ncbi:hypothetical protein [Staphylococcus aureus]|nr:hypothetical protein [Staphylococcus aureus]
MKIVGEIEGGRGIIIEDIIDRGGRMSLGGEGLKDKGGKEVYGCCRERVL